MSIDSDGHPPEAMDHFGAETHQPINLGRELADYSMYLQDRALVEAVHREGAVCADTATGRQHWTLPMPTAYSVLALSPVLAGDGVGPEITAATVIGIKATDDK